MTAYRQCFERAVAAAMAGAVVLTANTRSARTVRASAESRLRTERAVWPSPRVVPFEALIEQLFFEAVAAGHLSLLALSPEQELELWHQIIQRSAVGRQMLLPTSAAALAAQAFRLACDYHLPLDSSLMAASADTRAFAGWAGEFEQQLAAHRWSCSAHFARELTPHLAELALPESLYVFVDELVPRRRQFLAELAENGVLVEGEARDGAMESSGAQRREFAGAVEELQAAAQWARRQIEMSPTVRVGVVVFDLDHRRPQVESAFRAALNPENLLGQPSSEAFEIAAPLALADYPILRCALDLLHLLASPLEFSRFRVMLASPYFAFGATADAVARFLASITVQAQREVRFADFQHWLTASDELVELRARLTALPIASSLATARTLPQWVQLARQLLQAFGWPNGVALASTEFQCMQSWRDLLAAIVSLELLESQVDYSTFLSHLERAATRQQFKPESRNAPVQIMDVAEADGSTFDALWLASASDELWPTLPPASPLLPISLLRDAGWPLFGTPAGEAWIARHTARLLDSAAEVVVSLARRSEDDREQRWSPLFTSLPQRDEPTSASSLADSFASVALDALADQQAPALTADEKIGGGTALLEDQSACPFRAFAIRRLHARQSEGPNDALSATARGKLVERALQLVWEQLGDSEQLRQHDDCGELLANAVDRALSEEFAPTSDDWTVRFRQLERERTIALLREWLACERKRPPFLVLAHQQPVEMRLGGLTLHGRLDRLDEVDEQYLVIDYKTGVPDSVNSWSVPRPRRPQLPFYAAALRQQKFDLAGIAYAALRRGDCMFRAYGRDKEMLKASAPHKDDFNGAAFDDYLPLWQDELTRLASDFVAGAAAVDPKSLPGHTHSPCEYCHLSALCRIASATDDEEAEAGDNDE